MAVAVSDIDSYDSCTIAGCPHHEKTPTNSPIKFTQTTPKSSPVIEKNPTFPRTENRNIESNNSTNKSTAQTPLPPPVMLFVEENYKTQMAAITKEIPKIRSHQTGDFLKLYTDTHKERRLAVQLLKKLQFQFYTLKAKADRPIKVVIKGLPRTSKPEEIKEDLELLGYTPE
ncbi:hypothetical protein TNCV_3789781 [Trichonephila clavipes]|nr:hypothetical protein TNCV_3789781 [Trichonephila clavipes]